MLDEMCGPGEAACCGTVLRTGFDFSFSPLSTDTPQKCLTHYELKPQTILVPILLDISVF